MAINTAIRHLQRGDWQKAHPIVQNDDSDLGSWAHGIVHMLEGDIGNARYWFRRAGRPFPKDRDPRAEIDALVAMLKERMAAAAATARHQQSAEGDAPARPSRRPAAEPRASGAAQQSAATARAPKQQR
jgi:hypothetical protein